jgi:predicted transposase YdaD
MALARGRVLQQRAVQLMRQQYSVSLALALAQQRTMPAWLQRMALTLVQVLQQRAGQRMALALVQVLQQRAGQPMRQQYTAALALVQQRAMRCWLRCGLTS